MDLYIQGSAIRGVLGCVNPAYVLPLAVGGEFTQPRAHLLADPCSKQGKHGQRNFLAERLRESRASCQCIDG